MTIMWIVISLIIIAVSPLLLSYAVEALREEPETPHVLSWAPDIPIQFLDIDGLRIRYIEVGEGPPLVLLHTLRTQLDVFHKVIPKLSRNFRVYALDYPGHGYSDIPRVQYTPQYFADCVSQFMQRMNIQDAIVAGESIGGSIVLLLAAHQDPHIKKAIAINPYDYDKGRGVLRSSWIAKLVFGLNNVPLIGAMFWRSRSLPIFELIMQGGIHNADAISDTLMREMYLVGNRPYHYQALMSLIRNFPQWEQARGLYSQITIPVLLIYGEYDWSRPEERNIVQQAIETAEIKTVRRGGHFLSLDVPKDVVRLISRFSQAAQ